MPSASPDVIPLLSMSLALLISALKNDVAVVAFGNFQSRLTPSLGT